MEGSKELMKQRPLKPKFPEVIKRAAPYGPYKAIVTRIIDGDTLRLALSVGFAIYTEHAIRIKDIDAPETNRGSPEERERGRASRDYLIKLMPVGSSCAVLTHQDKMSFNRYVASVTLPDGRDLGTVMVDAGMAKWISGATP